MGSSTPVVPTLNWEQRVSLLGQPILLRSYAIALGATALVVGGLMAFILAVSGESEGVLPLLGMLGLVLLGLAVLFLLVILLVFGNRMTQRFTLDARGVASEVVDRRARGAARLLILLGLLTGKAGAVGTGLIAAGDRTRALLWSEVGRVRYDPRRHVVALGNSWRTVVILFCTPQNYASVASAVAAATLGRLQRRRHPLPRLLLHTLLVALALVPIFRLPYPFERDLLLPILVLCFALATVWLIPLLAWVVVAGCGWLVVELALVALETRQSQFGSGSYRVWEVLDGSDWMALGLAGLGVAYLLWLSQAALRGRFVSGLMAD